MTGADSLEREVAELRDRLSRLSQASLRINESLDFETVLQGVLDSARSLTDATYGVATVLGAAGVVEHVLASGMDEDEALQLWNLPGAADIFQHIAEIPHAQRMRDFPAQLRAWGLPDFAWPIELGRAPAFLGAPIRHLGETVGNFYLLEKQGGEEFTEEDEETLVMFASEAALVIANAHTYREEQRARADLETLVNTAPVGVVVLDTTTGTVLWVNHEAKRIGGDLLTDYGSVEDLFGVVTVRRADGREFTLGTFPAEGLSHGETVRAEEILVTVPDGRSVAVLVNATPIHTTEGELDSYVVTMQDLAPLRELERLRAEFLAMVSHELRTPLTSIKGSITTLLNSSSELDPAEVDQFFRIIDEQSEHMRYLISDLLDVARIETGTLAVTPQPSEVRALIEQARTRFVSAGGENGLLVDLPPDLPWVMADTRRIVQVLTNLLSNASKYSPEGFNIRLTAARDGVHVAVSVLDCGTGLPEERLPDLFRKFSRLAAEDQGRAAESSGLGLAICKGIVEAHGGRIWAESRGPGQGTRFTFTVPVVENAVSQPARLPDTSGADEAGHERILVVDDDPEMLRYVREVLSEAGYAPVVTGDPDDVLRFMEEVEPHLVLLDLVLPDSDGIDLMGKILGMADIPVIFISAYGRDRVIAEAFDKGASDYVVKPFSPTELVARIRAALRRRVLPEPAEPARPYVLGDLHLDYARRTVSVAGRPLSLTAMEYRLLRELSLHAGAVLTYEHLLRRFWGRGHAGDRRPMRTVLGTLRRKLGDDANAPRFIFTEPRVGYRMPEGE